MRKFLQTGIFTSTITLGSLFIALPAFAQFGLPSLPGLSKSSSAAMDPDAFVKSAKEAESLMNNSVSFLASALSSKEKAAEFEEAQKAANALTNPEEKKAKLAEVQKSQVAAINEATNNADMKSKVANMDSKKKEGLGASAFNFMLAVLKDKDLADQAQGVISSISSNPMAIGKLGSVKDAASSLSNQVASASQIAGKMPDIFSVVSVKAPVSKDEKPKVTAEVTGE